MLREISPEIHDEFLMNSNKEHFMQCSLWAKVKESSGWTSKIVGLYEEDKLVASTLLLLRKIPGLGSMIAYAPRGYVLDFTNWNLVKKFTDELKKYCEKHNVCYLMVDPDLHYRVKNAKEEVIEENLEIVDKMKEIGYLHQGFNLSFDQTQPRYTFRLKLDHSKEETFSNYSKIVRSSMNNATRIGITCKKEENIDIFYDIMEDTANRAGFVERNKEYYKTIFELYGKRGMSTCYSATYTGQAHIQAMNEKEADLLKEKQKCEAKLEVSPQDTKSKNRISQIEIQEEKLKKDLVKAEEFVKEYPDGLALSSGLTIATAHRAWLVYGGNRAILREAGANYAIKQFEINDDIDKHYEFVDFFGTIGNPTPESVHIGIHEFKKKFSGDYIEFPGEFHLVLKPIHYAIWTKIAPKAKDLLRSLKRRKKES